MFMIERLFIWSMLNYNPYQTDSWR